MNSIEKILDYRLKLTSVFLFTILHCTAYGQSNVSGNVYLNNKNTPADMAQVITSDKNNKTIGITYCDKNGFFELNTDTSVFNLTIEYIGYESQIINTQTIKAKDNIFILKSEINDLGIVEVKGEKITSVVKGDTITHNLVYYKQETDQNLGDVLQRLENVSVENNTILYNDKSVDKILVEGKDIVNDQHKITLENIAPKEVSKIQFIKKYKPFHERFFGDISDKIAMNIVLTEKAKIKINGNIAVAGGIKNKYEANTTLYTANDESGISTFIKSNNLGNTTVTKNDFVNLQSSLTRTLNKTQGDLSSLVPETLKDKPSQNTDFDNLWAFNFDKSLSDQKNVKFTSLTNYTDRKGRADINRVLFQNATPLIGKDIFDESLLFNNSVANYKATINKNTLLEIDIPFKYQKEHGNKSFNGLILSSTVDNNQLLKTQNITTEPNIYYSKKLNDNNTLLFDIGANYQFLNKNNTLSSEENLFDTSKNSIDQSIENKVKGISITPKWEYRKNRYSLTASSAWNYNHTTLTSSNIFTEGNTINQAFNNVIKSTLQLRYQTKTFFVEPQLNYAYVNLKVNDKPITHNFINPSFTSRYNFNRFKYFLLTGKLSTNNYAVENYFNTTEIINNISIRQYLIDSNKNKQQTKSLSLSFTDINMRGKYHYMVMLSYNHTKNGLFFVNETFNDYIIHRKRVSDFLSNVILRNTLSRKLRSKTLTLQTINMINYMTIKQDISIKLLTVNSSLKLISNFKKNYNGSLKINYGYSSQKYNMATSSFSNLKLSHDVDYKIDKTQFNISGDYTMFFGQKNNYFYNLGFKISHFFNNHWSIYLQGRDVFNLGENQVQNYYANQTYYQTATFNRFPGSVVLGVKMIL